MTPTVPALGMFDINQFEIGIMDQPGGLQRLTRLFLRQPRRRQFP